MYLSIGVLALLNGAFAVACELDSRRTDAQPMVAPLHVGDRLALSCPGNERFEIELVEAMRSRIGGDVFWGRGDGAGDLLTATIVKNKRGLTVTFTSPTDGHVHVIRSTASGLGVRKVNPADFRSSPMPSLVPEPELPAVRRLSSDWRCSWMLKSMIAC